MEGVTKLNVGRRRRVHGMTLKLGYIMRKGPVGKEKKNERRAQWGFFLFIQTGSADNCPPKRITCIHITTTITAFGVTGKLFRIEAVRDNPDACIGNEERGTQGGMKLKGGNKGGRWGIGLSEGKRVKNGET
ncbi:unnamed protein product [Sphenostylis stenocarpa]|uniref:Uncharacterized protein n=1 Tax=Sphenostylis stenocarpa TaxID=92480 RepID=A0AA86SL97_9FABA|nr:unnamed protein product [Sphenostylis stenocarpa]